MALIVNATRGNLTLKQGYLFARMVLLTKGVIGPTYQRPLGDGKFELVPGYKRIEQTEVEFLLLDSAERREVFQDADIIARVTVLVPKDEDEGNPVAAAYARLPKQIHGWEIEPVGEA